MDSNHPVQREQESIAEENFLHFQERGPIIFHDAKDGLTIRSGWLYEGRTVKGHKNLVVTARVMQFSQPKPYTDGRGYREWLSYGQGKFIRRVPVEVFARAIRDGDLAQVNPQTVDTERLDMAMIMFDGLMNGRTPEQTLKVYEEEATEYLQSGQFRSPIET